MVTGSGTRTKKDTKFASIHCDSCTSAMAVQQGKVTLFYFLCTCLIILLQEHVESLVKGHDAWSISELVHALLLISTFVSLAGFLIGCGATPEIDLWEPEEKEGDDDEDEEVASNQGYIGSPSLRHQNPNDRDSKEGVNDTVKLMELLKKGISEDEESTDKATDFANAGTDGMYHTLLTCVTHKI